MKKTPTSAVRRITALGLGLAMIGSLSFVTAAPASAEPAPFQASGTVISADTQTPLAGAQLTIDDGPTFVADADGAFSLSVEYGTHDLTVSAAGYVTQTSVLDMPPVDIDMGQIALTPVESATPGTATFTISGVVAPKDADSAFAPSVRLSGVAGSSSWWIAVEADGSFRIPSVDPNANLELTVSAAGYGTQVKAVPVTDADVTVSIVLLPNLTAGTVTISGTQAVGSSLTATPAGWPAGTTFTYAWGAVAPHAQSSGDIYGVESSTLPVTADIVNKRVWVQAIGHLDGFADGYADGFNVAPRLPIAAAPVADSADLAAFLAASESTPASQTSTGLPAGALNPAQSYTANVQFAGSDSYVDAYLYSSPISVGTFPVVNGVAQITLSPSVLSQLAAGSHTLVVVGQFSGAVSSVSLSVAAASATAASTTATLAATGFNPAVPFGAAALVMLLGGALVLRRRNLHV